MSGWINHRFELEKDVRKQRHIVCSIFPEKLHFDGERYGTPEVNPAAEAIRLINSKLFAKEKRKKAIFR